MAKDVEIKVKVSGGDEIDKTGGKFTALSRQIRETKIALQEASEAGDTVKFNKLKAQLDDLDDSLEKTTLQSKQFDDALASLPGPAGQAGNAIKSVDGAFKLLIANPIVAVIAVAVGIFLALKKSLESTAEGQATLNRVQSAFSSVLGPILATLEAVAVPLFEGLAYVIEKVGSAFSYFAEALGITDEKIEEATLSVDKAGQEANKAEADRSKEAQDARDKAEAERQQKAKEAQAKRKQIQDEANKILLEAELSILTDRNRELKERELRYEEEKKALKLAGIKNLTKFEEEYRIDKLAVNKKYDDAEQKIKDDADAKAKADREKKEEQDKADREKKAEQDKADREKKLEQDRLLAEQALNDRREGLEAQFTDISTNRALTFQEELQYFDQARSLDREGLVANKASQAELLLYDKQTAKARVEIEKAQQSAKLAVVSDALGTIADAVGRESAAGKAFAVAQAVINTYQGATKALATYPPPFGAIAAGAVIVQGLMSVKKIVSTKLPAPPGGKSAPSDTAGNAVSSAGLGGGAGAPSAQNVAPNLIPVIGSSQATAGSAIAGTLNSTFAQNQQRPIQAFVVSGEVSSAQQLERRRNTSAQLGG